MMASWMNNLRSGFSGKRADPQKGQVPSRSNTGSPAGFSPSGLGAPNIPAAPASPSLSAMATNDQAHQANLAAGKKPLFFREEYSGFIVKGNFMTLAAKPRLIEEAEWLAHQIVEQNRLLSGMIKCVQSPDKTTGQSVCNESTCPTMSAGPYVYTDVNEVYAMTKANNSTTYTWIDTNRNPINLPAAIYIKHIQTWVNGKIIDQSIFPTDTFTTAPALPHPDSKDDPNFYLGKTSGFPKRFEAEVKNMYKQMFRCYAHLYWEHWLVFWELGSHRELNTCFVHFMNVGRIYGLLNDKDVEPMAPLVETWTKQGVLQPLKGESVTSAPEQKPANAGSVSQMTQQTVTPASS